MHFLMPLVRDKNSSTEYVEFLKLLDDKYPKGDKLRIVLDNLKFIHQRRPENTW